jgi:hypothetical protein
MARSIKNVLSFHSCETVLCTLQSDLDLVITLLDGKRTLGTSVEQYVYRAFAISVLTVAVTGMFPCACRWTS